MNSIAFLAFVFPSIEVYLDDFFTSLQLQTIKNFDVFIINDGLKNFNNYKHKYKNLNIIDVNYNNTQSKIREFGINFVLNKNYDFILFGDADDYFDANRIEITLANLQNNDIVINDLTLVNVKKNILKTHYFSKRIANNNLIKLDFIVEKNLCGLSNSAIRGDLIKKVTFNKHLLAVDWYLFSILLINNYRAIFTNKTTTYYRQHSRNTIGLLKEINKDSLAKAIKVKLLHYRILSKYSFVFKNLYTSIQTLSENIKDEHFLNNYLEHVIKTKTANPLWWEEIKTNEIF